MFGLDASLLTTYNKCVTVVNSRVTNLLMSASFLTLTPDDRPRLLSVVDTEEEFDWSQPFSREATTVRHIERIGWLQEVFDEFRAIPAYVVGYPIASQKAAYLPLRTFIEEQRACLGAHLHPWVTPPYSEELSKWNSYGGNLSEELERAKLSNLTGRIEQSFGSRPRVFKAGRYGVGPNTLRILSNLGYTVDLSPAPPLDCSGDGGPNFSKMSCAPFQDDKTGLLVIPGTGSFSGWWPGDQAAAHGWATTSWRNRVRANMFLSRSGAVHRLWLSPESFSATTMIRYTGSLVKRGVRSFVVSLHSPVVMAGATPFARNEGEVTELLGRLREYLRFFFGELQGEAWTPQAALDYWSAQPAWRVPRPVTAPRAGAA